MNQYLYTIEKRIRRRKRLRFAAYASLLLLPAMAWGALQWRNLPSAQMEYAQANIPAVSVAQVRPVIDSSALSLPVETERSAKPAPTPDQILEENIPTTVEPSAPLAKSQGDLPQKDIVPIEEGKDQKPAEVEKEATPKARKESIIDQESEHFISMPPFESLPLRSKMNLMRNTAYSPQDKQRLKHHIIGLFGNETKARVEVVKSVSGKRETISYPIALYLDRLDKQPATQFRLAEKVMRGGQMSGLVVRE
ncbi:MAG: hypothetical protein AAGM67_02275 [Bacteroidota bacterium]